MLNKSEIWTKFTKRVLATSRDASSAAKRLHNGHELIFGQTRKTEESIFEGFEKIEHNLRIAEITKQLNERTKEAIWRAVLNGSEMYDCNPYEKALFLLEAHNLIFGDEPKEKAS